MTIEEIKALAGVDVEETEKFVKVTPQSGYVLLVKNESTPEGLPDNPGLPDGETGTEAEQWTETDSVYLPIGCTDAPELSTEERSTVYGGIATADEVGSETITTLEERVLRLEARVSALEADMAAMGTGDGGAAMVIDDEL